MIIDSFMYSTESVPWDSIIFLSLQTIYSGLAFCQFVPSTGRKEADRAARTDEGCETLLRKAALQLQTQILYSWQICGLVNLEVKCSLKWKESIQGSTQHCLVLCDGAATGPPEDLRSTVPQTLLASHHILLLLYCQL